MAVLSGEGEDCGPMTTRRNHYVPVWYQKGVAGVDPRAVHDSFQNFFAYIDAQKIRTPKGLDWIRARYGQIDQVNLMLEMQALRQMHCTMWLEAVREVVSAEDSDVKFIVSDH